MPMRPRKAGGVALHPPPRLEIPPGGDEDEALPAPSAPPAADDHDTMEAGALAPTPQTTTGSGTGQTQLLASARAGGAGGSSGQAPQGQRMDRYVAAFSEVKRRSPFELWPREALVDVLIQRNIELRHEADLEHDQLVKICNRYFADKPLPALPPPRPLEAQAAAEAAAVVIQRRWVRHAAVRRHQRMLQRQGTDRALLADGVLVPPAAGQPQGHQQQPPPPPPGRTTPRAASRELEAPWVPPDVALAKEFAEFNHPRKGGPGGPPFALRSTTLGRYCTLGGCGEQLDLWDEGQVSELSPFGSGVSNYFKFEKWCAWTFLCLFIIYSPMLLLNAFGADEPVRAGGLNDMGKTTLGNLVRAFETNGGYVVLPFCDRLAGVFPDSVDCTLSRRQVAMLYTWIDIAGCLFLFVAFSWMKTFQKWEVRNLERHTVTASDFTVKVTNLPETATEADIKVHFARVLEVPVVDVAIGFDNAEEIEKHKHRGVLVKRRNWVVNRYRYITDLKRRSTDFSATSATHGAGASAGGPGLWLMQRELPYLKKQNEALLKAIARLDAQIGAAHVDARPFCAFVTFDSQEAFVHALSVYDDSPLTRLCMPDILRLKGRRLRVEPAPEPSLILWENLQFSRLDRLRRKLTTTFAAGSLILVSVVFAGIARYYQDQNRGTDASCPEGWSSLSEESQRVAASAEHAFLGCFCAGKPFHAQARDSLCKIYVQKESLAVVWTLFASFMVVAMNYAIQRGLELMTHHAHSLDRQKLEVAVQVFVLKFINTAGVFLLLNSPEVQGLIKVNLRSQGNFTREFYMTTGLSLLVVMLINVVGPVVPYLAYYLKARKTQRKAERGELTGLVTQDQMNAVFMGPEFPVAIRYAATLVTFFVCFIYAGGMPLLLLIAALTFFLGYWADKFLFLRYWRIPPQYGKLLSRGVANTLQYALLLHICASMWAFAQDDLFQAPQDTSSPLGRFVDKATRWTGPNVHRHLTKVNVLPLLVLLVVLAGCMAARQLWNGLLNGLRALVRFLTCQRKRRAPRSLRRSSSSGGMGGGVLESLFGSIAADVLGGELSIIDVTYMRALERGLIKGLHTYNILQNPIYKQAFSLSDRFAERHRHLESLRGRLALPFEDDESDGDGDGDGDGSEEFGDAAEELPVEAEVYDDYHDVEAAVPQRWSSPVPARVRGQGQGQGQRPYSAPRSRPY